MKRTYENVIHFNEMKIVAGNVPKNYFCGKF